jgi:hypothetical protein
VDVDIIGEKVAAEDSKLLKWQKVAERHKQPVTSVLMRTYVWFPRAKFSGKEPFHIPEWLLSYFVCL